ncbi:MAG: glycosyltransferase [Fibrobacteria bacterium]
MSASTIILEILWGLALAATALMLMVTVLNALTAPLLEQAPPARPARVSLLIPARDEEANLALLLPMLSRLQGSDLEILILDDGSSDGTADLVRQQGAPIRLLPGRPLPPGWLGKNWACSQLAEAASGEILIFCDADAQPGPGAVAATVGLMQDRGWDALTVLPRQILGTWSEKAILPVLLFLPLLGLCPIAWIPKLRMPALSVGCGQWFAFRAETYRALGGHACVRTVIVEDMALGRRVKDAGKILGVAISTRHISVRMYSDFHGVWNGFTKNAAYMTGTGWLQPPLVFGVFALVNVLPWTMVAAGQTAWILPLAFWTASRILAAVVFREPISSPLWSPVGALLIPALFVRSWVGYRRRYVTWKGRSLEAAFHTGKETA